MKEYLIKDIEALKEYEVLKMDHEAIEINGHQVYLVDFGGYFGYSALVFRAGAHLYYANDYELHHKHMTRPELKKWYLETMKNKLFSDDMIPCPVNDYIEAENKEYYLRNYYPLMCEDKISAFNIFHNDREKAAFEELIKDMTYSRVGFFYSNDKDFISRLDDLYITAIKSKEGSKDNYNYWYEAFKYEMFNHEYVINWEADFEVISCFARVKYSENLPELFKAAKFTDIQIKAYREARNYVCKNMEV